MLLWSHVDVCSLVKSSVFLSPPEGKLGLLSVLWILDILVRTVSGSGYADTCL